MAENIDLTFRANLKNLTDQLASLPDVTAKEAKGMVRALERETKKAERALKRNAKQVDREWQGRMGSIKQAGATAFGDSINKVSDLGSGIAALGGPIGLAVVGVASITVAIGAAVGASIALTRQMDELIEANAHLEGQEGFGFDPALTADIDQANASLDLLAAIVRQVAIGIGDEVVPVVADASRVVLKLGLMAMDTFNGMAEGGGMVGDVIDKVVRTVFTPWLELILTIADGYIALATLMGIDLPESVTGLTDVIREATSVTAWLGWGMEKLDTATSGYDDRVNELIGTQVRHNAAQRDGASATGENAAAMEEARLAAMALADATRANELAAESWQQAQEEQAAAALTLWQITEDYRRSQLDERVRLEEDTAAQLAEVQLLAHEAGLEGQSLAADAEVALRQQLADQLWAITEKSRDDRIRAEDEVAAAQRENLLSSLDAAGSIVGSINDVWESSNEAYISSLNKNSDEYKKVMMLRFRVGQGIAIAEAITQGALAAVVGIAQFGPPPSPPGIAAIIAAAATTATAVTSIATQRPPTFHVGGMIGTSSRAAPDEVDIRARRDEGVVTRQGVQALAALNSGSMGGGGQVVVVQAYQHEIFDAQVQDSLSNPESSIRQAVREGQRRVGHSTRVRG